MTLTKAKAAAEVMLHLCEHAAHGYSQPARKGDGTWETVELSDGTKVRVHGGDYDCSEATRQAYAAVGVLPQDSYMWTGNERDLLLKYGFYELSFNKSILRVGDVLWKEGHTEIVVKPGYQGGFNGDENGGLGQGARKGDQTGYESYVKPVRDYWTKVFRYKEAEPKVYKEGWIYSASKKAWWYRYTDGTWPASQWKKVDNVWYWFDDKGWMASNEWVEWKGRWYWLKKSGAMAAGECLKIHGKWYAFDSHGAMCEKSVPCSEGGSLKL